MLSAPCRVVSGGRWRFSSLNRRGLGRLAGLGWFGRANRLPDQTRNAPRPRDDFLRNYPHWFLHQERTAHCAVDAASFLAAFLAVVGIQVIWRDVHNMLVRVHHAANPKLSLRRDEEKFVTGVAGPLHVFVTQEAFLVAQNRLVRM